MIGAVQYSYPRIRSSKYFPCLLNVRCTAKENQIRGDLILVIFLKYDFNAFNIKVESLFIPCTKCFEQYFTPNTATGMLNDDEIILIR